MTLKLLPIKGIYSKVLEMLEAWNLSLDENLRYKEIVFQEVEQVAENNLYFTLDSISKNSYGRWDIQGMLYRDFNARNTNKFPSLVLFDNLEDENGSYLNSDDNYTLDNYGETSAHSRVISLNLTGMIIPDLPVVDKIDKIGYNIEEITEE